MKALAATALLVAVAAAPASAQAVKLQFSGGRVTLSATNAPLRAVLAEWARVGGATIVNADRVIGAPLTLELTDVPEGRALEIILRSVAGYYAGQRRAGSTAAAAFDRIVILPASTPTARQASTIVQTPRTPARPTAAEREADDDPPAVVVEPGDIAATIEERRRQALEAAAEVTRRALEQQRGGGRFVIGDRVVEDTAPDADQRPVPTNPFGVQRGAARPGVIRPPAAQPGAPVRPQDPEP